MTWYGKIATEHVRVADLLSEVEATATTPSAIATSRTVPGRYVFINTDVTTSKGHVLRVIVDPGQGHGTIASAYFSERKNEVIVWQPPKGQGR